MELTKLSHCVYHCRYHIVLRAKYRKKIFNEGILHFLRNGLKRLESIIH
ncbi:MAG TPA: transposase [Candidatus Avelusimicrobium excrementipullorum]|nr:transposase [Candidatus Avelusimicrobium excrementipullorum]